MWQSCRTVVVKTRRVLLVLAACLVLAGTLTPLLNGGTVTAAGQVTSRSVLISTGQAGATAVTYTFSLVPNTSAAIQSMKFQACTTAIGACTAPHGLSFSSVTGGTVSGSWTTLTNFTTNAGSNDCIASASIICATRSAGTAESTSGQRSVAFGTITNQDVNAGNCSGAINCTFFVRMTTYSVINYLVGNTVDTGTVASSTTTSLTVNATIQETLTFCIGATAINDGTTAPAACASISGTSLSLGTLTAADSSVSPVSGGNGGDSNNGIAELSTNASLGAIITYDAKQQTGTLHLGTLRVAGATCVAGTPTNDQCINAIGTTQATLTAGTEAYGMTIASVNCPSSPAYTCTFAGGTYHLIRDTNYDGTGGNTYPTDTNLVAGTTNAGYAWDETGTVDTIATSTTVVDREALILKFATTPNLVTPAGIYTALADFVATPTF